MLFATKSYQHQSRLIANLTMQKLISKNTCQQFSVQPHTLAALLPTSLYSQLLEDNRGTKDSTERGSLDKWMENLFSWSDYSTLHGKRTPSWSQRLSIFQSMLPIQIKSPPNPCGLLFLDSKRAGQHLPQLAPNPRALRIHSTFLLLMWNSSIPNNEDLCQGTQLTGKDASRSLTQLSI